MVRVRTSSVAFFRDLNLGQRRSHSPTRPELLEAFARAGATNATSFQVNGTVVFDSAEDPQAVADDVVRRLTAVCGYDDAVLVRPVPWVLDLDLGDLGPNAEVSFFDGPSPEKLWDYLAMYEEKTGGRAIAIPHNGNLSNGLMFSDRQFDGSPMTRDYAARRIRWEPLHEMSQMKGDEETHPLLSPEDEFADFERWDVGNISGSAPKTPEISSHAG